jgi:FkbM family methyltransferase
VSQAAPEVPAAHLRLRRLPPALRYLMEVLPMSRLTTFCDVGANPIHEPPYAQLLRFGACRVVGFEPNPDAFAELEKSRGPNELYFPLAVGDGETHVLHLYRNSGLSSIYPPHLPGLHALGRRRWAQMDRDVEMKTVALDKIADLPAIDCVKIDIQGGEKIVFENARRVMANAVAVIVEVRWMQLYEGEPMSGGVDEELRAQGFMLHKFIFNKSTMLANSQMRNLSRRANADQMIDGDAIYLRHPGKLDELSEEQLCHMAVLGGSVLSSHSLTVAVLDELVRRGKIDRRAPANYVAALPEELRRPDPAADQAEAETVQPMATEVEDESEADATSVDLSTMTFEEDLPQPDPVPPLVLPEEVKPIAKAKSPAKATRKTTKPASDAA